MGTTRLVGPCRSQMVPGLRKILFLKQSKTIQPLLTEDVIWLPSKEIFLLETGL
jgi:hypothetical protein